MPKTGASPPSLLTPSVTFCRPRGRLCPDQLASYQSWTCTYLLIESPSEVLRECQIELLGRPVERCLIRVSGAVDDVPPYFEEELPDSWLPVFRFDEFKDGVTEVDAARN